MWVAGHGIEWFSGLKIDPSAGRKVFVKVTMNLQVALKARSFFCNYAPSSFKRRCLLCWVGWHMMWVWSVLTIIQWNVNVNSPLIYPIHISHLIYPHYTL